MRSFLHSSQVSTRFVAGVETGDNHLHAVQSFVILAVVEDPLETFSKIDNFLW